MLAIDWGSSTVRAWRLGPGGEVRAERRRTLRLASSTRDELRDVLAGLRRDLDAEGLPAVACGMIGSAQGLVDAGYLDCPCSLDSLAGAGVVTDGLRILPGLACTGPSGQPDLMRGEETQLLGVLPESGPSLVCLPGTHSKWVRADGLRVERFATSMTGELRASLLRDGLIAAVADGEPEDEAAFAAGAALAREPGGLLHQLFAARTRVLRGRMPGRSVASWVSGLLVAHEVLAMERCFGAEALRVVGDPALARRYAEVIGPRAEVVDGDAAARTGLLRAARGGT